MNISNARLEPWAHGAASIKLWPPPRNQRLSRATIGSPPTILQQDPPPRRPGGRHARPVAKPSSMKAKPKRVRRYASQCWAGIAPLMLPPSPRSFSQTLRLTSTLENCRRYPARKTAVSGVEAASFERPRSPTDEVSVLTRRRGRPALSAKAAREPAVHASRWSPPPSRPPGNGTMPRVPVEPTVTAP